MIKPSYNFSYLPHVSVFSFFCQRVATTCPFPKSRTCRRSWWTPQSDYSIWSTKVPWHEPIRKTYLGGWVGKDASVVFFKNMEIAQFAMDNGPFSSMISLKMMIFHSHVNQRIPSKETQKNVVHHDQSVWDHLTQVVMFDAPNPHRMAIFAAQVAMIYMAVMYPVQIGIDKDTNWLVVWNIWIIFPSTWECHHPNWRTHIFQRGRYTTNQFRLICSKHIETHRDRLGCTIGDSFCFYFTIQFLCAMSLHYGQVLALAADGVRFEESV